jgi:hypothetical protein
MEMRHFAAELHFLETLNNILSAAAIVWRRVCEFIP